MGNSSTETTARSTAPPSGESPPPTGPPPGGRGSARAAPPRESRRGARAAVGILLELIGLVAVCILIPWIFREDWVQLTLWHWVMLGLSALSIVGLLLCISSVFSHRRGLAVAGIWLGIMASGLACLCGALMLASVLELWGVRPESDMISSTEDLLREVAIDLRAFEDKQYRPATVEEAERIINGRVDAWGNTLRYEMLNQFSWEVSSSGPDETFGTTNDIRRRADEIEE